MIPFATPAELAHALNNGFAVELDDLATAAEVARLAGPGLPIRTTIECCTGRCRYAPTYVIERAQRWDRLK
jgi:hypothetical protein